MHGSRRVAMRHDQNGTSNVYYLLDDHLSTTSTVIDSSGNNVAESRHFPFGSDRWTSGTNPTNYRFTGQREEAGIGLYYYNARWYDAKLGRFISADTLVPEPSNPQALNRYAYVVNNPLKFVDPTGHAYIAEAGGGGVGKPSPAPVSIPSAWAPNPAYSEWYSSSSSYSGCFRCHAAVSNGRPALTNGELAAVYTQMSNAQELGIEMFLRIYEPIDYAYTMRNCLRNQGCDPEEIYWTTAPFLAGSIARVDDLIPRKVALGYEDYLGSFSRNVGAENFHNWNDFQGGNSCDNTR